MNKFFYIVILVVSATSFTYGKSNVDSLLKVSAGSDLKAGFYAFKALSKSFKFENPQTAFSYTEKEMAQAIALKSRSLQAEASNDMAITLLLMQEHVKAIKLLEESFMIYDSLNDEPGKSMVSNNLGIAWDQFGSAEKSLKCYLSVVPFYEIKNDKENLARVFMNVGLVYLKLQTFDLSISYLDKASEIFRERNNTRMIADNAVNIGLTYKAMKKFKEAETSFMNALTFYRAQGIIFGEAVSCTNLAQVYKAERDFAKAKFWYTISLPLIRKMHNNWAEASLFFDLADINIQQGKWQDALNNLAIADHMNANEPDLSLQEQVFQSYTSIYDTLKEYKLAYAYQKKYMTLHDSLNSMQKTKVIEEMSIQYKIAQRVSENSLLRKDLEVRTIRNRMLKGIIVGGLILFLVLLTMLLLNRQRLILKKRTAERKAEFTGEELNKLSQELTSKAMQLASNAEKKSLISEKLLALNPYIVEDGRQLYQKISDDFNSTLDDNLWGEFANYFEKGHPEFMAKLSRDFPELTPNDKKICAMIRINLNTKETALILNRSVRTIESSRYQLKKKMNLAEDQNLTSFLMNI